ncbi:C40 family peptidase [Viridibacillus sp. YIM B01967]|uniref:C40 family peptidase n=1 Tax=Viridibacillus soli TaxID=2798301 RepID=A0ABS1HBG0_9BACL|nr:C40 family peptidase [Viridibacillus soli]MBK3496738.1 C40 family peptidase [Viridibacillus soli]
MKKKNLFTAITAGTLALTISFTGLTAGQQNTASAESLTSTNEVHKSTAITTVASSTATKISGKYKTTAALNMRKSASTKSKVILTAKKGAIVKATYKKKVSGTTWYKVTYNGKTGWMTSAYLKKYKKVSKVSNSATGSAIINAGRKYLGVPYVWGGTTPSGFDCSGFTQYTYNQAGMGSIPRNSRAQREAASYTSNPQVGDLIFFSENPGGSYITHVGLYAGNGQVLHAAGNQVQYQSISSGSYWGARIMSYGTFR